MPLPGDVSTTTVTFGPYTDASGAITLAGATAKLLPVDPATGKRLNLVHRATGQAILPASLPLTLSEDGSGSVGPVPHTDDPNLSVVGFAYRVEWSIASGQPTPGNKTFVAPAAAGASVDFDLLDAAEAVPGVHVPTRTVPTGGAGGALSGQYPNPDLNAAVVTALIGGVIVAHGAEATRARPDVTVPVIWFGSVPPAELADGDVYVATTPLS